MATKVLQGSGEVDWVKIAAVLTAGAAGIEKMLKVYRLWKAAGHAQTAAIGLTVKNGEYTSLIKTLGRIESRIDHLALRVESVESRIGA